MGSATSGRRSGWWLAALAALGLGGCGAEGPKVPLFPVSGQVLFGDAPAAGVEVRLFEAARPNDPDAHHPFATTDAEGTFRLGTFEREDGAPAGKYKVMLLWPEGPAGPGVPRDRLGRAFTDPAKSPFEVDVAAGVATLEPFRIDPARVKPSPVRSGDGRDPSDPTPAAR